ncbi:hypothetical protein CAPTEDRAFT_202530 [Capitella teleta]|uniref:Uncharacterized protein n=1 Tax=Capitella teleta TaxID=283909 RepID=R7VC40_CAPTE|nr:hypothetical protein CAPTEDRAFT_202530 [Capitella teleta]|eukprot:ELU13886.1 hypothetical protein CAPTEDRAFT_202530 [Capitella teleta]
MRLVLHSLLLCNFLSVSVVSCTLEDSWFLIDACFDDFIDGALNGYFEECPPCSSGRKNRKCESEALDIFNLMHLQTPSTLYLLEPGMREEWATPCHYLRVIDDLDDVCPKLPTLIISEWRIVSDSECQCDDGVKWNYQECYDRESATKLNASLCLGNSRISEPCVCGGVSQVVIALKVANQIGWKIPSKFGNLCSASELFPY